VNLFQRGNFVLAGGEKSRFKVDCDALTWDDIETLAKEIVRRLPPFRQVEGVPNGGDRLAVALRGYASEQREHPLLIVNDLYTTGARMEWQRGGRPALGAVIFARRPVAQLWIMALFTLTVENWAEEKKEEDRWFLL